MTDEEQRSDLPHMEPSGDTHSHMGPDGSIYVHTHSSGDGHFHPHTHSHTQTRAVSNRLSRAIGHLDAVKRMVENQRDCTEVLIQLSAVQSAINNTAKIILKDHIQNCMMDAVYQNDQQALNDLNDVIEKFMH